MQKSASTSSLPNSGSNIVGNLPTTSSTSVSPSPPQNNNNNNNNTSNNNTMDELPKHLPDPSEIPKPKTEKERFPYQVFANCIGADGFNIMGYRVTNTSGRNNTVNQQAQIRRTTTNNNNNKNNNSSHHQSGKESGTGREQQQPLRLSRERLEAFLAMTQEHSSNTRSILGAVSWNNGTVLFPIGREEGDDDDDKNDDSDANTSNNNTGGKMHTPNSRGIFSQNNVRKTTGTGLPPPFIFSGGNNNQKSPITTSANTALFSSSNNNNKPSNSNTTKHETRSEGGNTSVVSNSPTDNADESTTNDQFPAGVTTNTNRETDQMTSLSAHSSDYNLAEAVAIAAATRGLNPMSAQAAALRAAAIQRREQRLKKRKEQDILAKNIERCERFGLAGLDVPALVQQHQQLKSRGSTPPPPSFGTATTTNAMRASPTANQVFSSSTNLPPNRQNNSNKFTSASPSPTQPQNNNNINNLLRSSGGALDARSSKSGEDNNSSSENQQARSESGDDSSSHRPPSSMPDLQSATTSELGTMNKNNNNNNNDNNKKGNNNNKNNNMSSPNTATRTPVSQPDSNGRKGMFPAFTSTTAKDRPKGGKSSSSPSSANKNYNHKNDSSDTPPSLNTNNNKHYADPHQNNNDDSPPISPNDDDDNDNNFDNNNNNKNKSASSPSKTQQQQRKKKDPTAVGVPTTGQGLSESDWKRLYKEEQRLMKNKIRIEDFGNKGRGVRSTAVIESGELIWRCRPHLGVLYNDFMKEHCAHCFRPSLQNRTAKSSSSSSQHVCLATTDSMVMCPFCESFALCNDCGGKPELTADEKTHQQHPSSTVSFLWRRHLDWCKWLRTLPESVRKGDTDYLRFLLEYASRVQGGDLEVVQAIAGLCSLEDAQSDEVKQFCESYSRLCATTFGGTGPNRGMSVSQAALKEALMRIKCNALGFPFTREATIGWAVHGTVCMLNHSCSPNAALTQSPLGEMEIRAIKPISPSQEISISYIHVPDFPSKAERRKHLLTQYRFLCRCDLCEGTQK